MLRRDKRHEQVQDERKKKKKKGQVPPSPPPPPGPPSPPSPPCTVCSSGCPLNSVQAAINAASAGATITLCAGIYEGNVAVDRDLTLIGAGHGGVGQTRLEGTGSGRVVTIAAGRTVTLRSLRITGGTVDVGAGIFNEGQLTLIDCTITENDAGGNGGGIYNVGDGTLALTGCTISANTSTSAGGGIFNDGTCTIEASSITGNTAGSFGGGLCNSSSVYFDAAQMTLTNTTVSGNTADIGGGIDNSDMLTLNASTLERNTARVQGGGLDNWSGTATLNDSTVARNTAPTGGGIFVRSGEVTLDASQVNLNAAEGDGVSGGGIMNHGGTVNVTNGSSVRENTADFGAGIYTNVDTTLTLTDSGITANIATNLGGGINNNGTVNLLSGSIMGNRAEEPGPSGGGIINDGQVNFTAGFDISGNIPDQCFDNAGNGCPP